MFSRHLNELHVFPRLQHVTCFLTFTRVICFPAFARSYKFSRVNSATRYVFWCLRRVTFSRVFNKLYVFPRLQRVPGFPRLHRLFSRVYQGPCYLMVHDHHIVSFTRQELILFIYFLIKFINSLHFPAPSR